MTDFAFRAVLFDLDGTLGNTLPLCIRAYRLALEPVAGRVLSDTEIVATFGPSEEGTIRALAPDRHDECLAEYLRHYTAGHGDYPDLFAGMAALLGDLRARGVRLGLVTGKGVESTRISLRQYGIENLFDVIETGSPHGPRKAEALRDVLAACRLRPEQAVYVGDAPTDVDAARAVGMPVVSAAWAATAETDVLRERGPDLLAHSVDELRAWLWPRLDAAPEPAGGWLRIAQRLQALAQAGLAYNPHVFDAERYEEVLALSHEMMAHLTGHPVGQLANAVALEKGYPTPKVDIRAVLFRGPDEILMVREKHDGGRWSLPGGWADVGCTPSEAAVKEVREETGLDAQAVRLLALWDKRVHPHPPQTWYVYKAFILCRPVGGTLLADTAETTEVRWVGRHELPGLEISVDRVTLSQLERLFAFAAEPNLPALCD